MKICFLKFIIVFCIMVSACAHQVARSRDTLTKDGTIFSDDECQRLLEKSDALLFTSKVLIGVSGATAVTVAIPEWGNGARWGLAAGSATAAALGGATAWYGERVRSEFDQYCKEEEIIENKEDKSLQPKDGGIDEEDE